jgi:DNA polymerase (family 10)
MKGITILVGTEVDILATGRLDYPDDLLARCDVVVASVHSGLSQPRDIVTARVMAAMDNPFVTLLGHPSGRLIGRREPMDLDWEAVIAHAVETQTVLEINSSWQRLDLKDVHARMAVEAGVLLSIDTDSHRTDTLDFLRFGVLTARRGWVQKDQVINTSPLKRLRALLKRKR